MCCNRNENVVEEMGSGDVRPGCVHTAVAKGVPALFMCLDWLSLRHYNWCNCSQTGADKTFMRAAPKNKPCQHLPLRPLQRRTGGNTCPHQFELTAQQDKRKQKKQKKTHPHYKSWYAQYTHEPGNLHN